MTCSTAHHPARRIARYALVIAAVTLAQSAADARAKVVHGELPELIVKGRAESFTVPLHGEQMVFLYCAEEPKAIDSKGDITHTYARADKVIVLYRKNKRAEPAGVVTAVFETYTAHIKVGETPEFFRFMPAYRLGHITDHQAHERQIQEEVAQRMVIEAQELESKAERHFVRNLAQSRQLFPVVEQVRRDEGADLSLAAASATWVGKKLYLTVDLENGSSQPFHAADVVVYDKSENAYAARVMAMSPEPEPGEPLLLAPRGDARLVVAVDKASKGDFSGVRVEFRDPATNRMVWMAVDEWQHNNPFMVPVTPQEIARKRRARQTTVSVRGLFGGFWTTAGGDLGGLDGTTLAGLGVRVLKGYENGFGVEGDFVLASSGDAQFDNTSWSGMSGSITRSAKLGRALGGVAMRFGHQYVFTGRAGLGIQLANYDSTFTAGGALIDGPGDGLEVDGVWSVGGGFDARLGEHWGLGAAVMFVDAFNTDSRSLEAALHLGYGWN